MSSVSVHSPGDFSPSEVAVSYATRLPNLQQHIKEISSDA
jgi:hypothetical protein